MASSTNCTPRFDSTMFFFSLEILNKVSPSLFIYTYMYVNTYMCVCVCVCVFVCVCVCVCVYVCVYVYTPLSSSSPWKS
jgi:hypothetical protein